MTRGGITPLPMRKTSPPVPASSPGPTPRPLPGPIPPPVLGPIPPNAPGQFEGKLAEDLGSPRFGKPFIVIAISGGTTTVGSTANLGLGFRMTAAGGASCCIENFGKRPTEAGKTSRSPPPPPPPACVFADFHE